MFRFIVYLVIGYFLWKVIQTFTSSAGRRQGPQQGPPQQGSRPTPPRTFSNVKDAEFEDVTPKKDEGATGKGPSGPGGSGKGPSGPGT